MKIKGNNVLHSMWSAFRRLSNRASDFLPPRRAAFYLFIKIWRPKFRMKLYIKYDCD